MSKVHPDKWIAPMFEAPRAVYAALVLAVVLALYPGAGEATGPVAAAAPAEYVGSTACARCHEEQAAVWRTSQHRRAMAEAADDTVLGDFAHASFEKASVTTRFFRRDGKYFVNTEGPDGKAADFEIQYTFGIYPLQQYLIALPGGRFQALGIAWDSRPRSDGGQRWFDLYPDRTPRPGDPLHWTGIDQTWNYQCADCHSTNLRKNYDASTRTYRTTWSEISVGCEACHGPGSEHVAWAAREESARRGDLTKGLAVALDERSGVSWTIDPASGQARRSRARNSSFEIETCARCHARRGQFSDAWTPGRPIGDAFRIALIEPGLYYPDGQMRGEVYNYGSFLQSRMQAKGVTCSDCHEPHSDVLRAPGNAVCGPCHAPARFDTSTHHHHEPGSPGAACAACHMPTTTYMVVDPRHDHSIRIPRPDRSVSLGVPNACGGCHAKQGAKWAANAVTHWRQNHNRGYQSFAEAFVSGDRGAPGAAEAIARLVADASQPPFVRASAMDRLVLNPGTATLPALTKALADADPLVRAAGAQAAGNVDPALRSQLLARLLADPVREVRMAAARSLAGLPEAHLAAQDRIRFKDALDELVAAAAFIADRPEGHAELGTLAALRGESNGAETEYRAALELDPTYAPASVNLADLYRDRGREREAEQVLRDAIRIDPKSVAPRHALGLSLIRQKRFDEALPALAQATRLAPDDAHYAYVYAVALHDVGRQDEATRTLNASLARNPYDREVLFALLAYEREAGRNALAAQRARRLLELEPGNPQLRQILDELTATGEAKKR